MLKYYIYQTAITIDLTIVSGGISVTGRAPTVEIFDRNLGQHFDFAVRAFNAAPATTGVVLNSAIEGLYRYTWDVSGLFNTNTFLLFEYHDATSVTTDDVAFVRPPLTTADVTVSVGGAPQVITMKGVFSKEDQKKMFKQLDVIEDDIEHFRQVTIGALKQLLSVQVIKIEDIKFLTDIKERDLNMFQELLKILSLKSTANEKEIFEKLTSYIKGEEKAKKEVMVKLNELLTAKQEIPEVIKDDDEGEDE